MVSSISSRENQVLTEIEERDMFFFTPRDVSNFLNIGLRNAYNLLSGMEEKELITRIESGRYVLNDKMEELDVYELASNIVGPSYLGFYSAAHFHSLTEQVPRNVQVASTKRKRDMKIQGSEIEFVKIKPEMYYGYRDYDRAIVSDPEKTVVDCLMHPGKAGGIRNVLGFEFEDLQAERLERYCLRTGSSALSSRLGFLMERKGMDFNTDAFKQQISHYTKLDPKNEREKPHKRWKLYVNVDLE